MEFLDWLVTLAEEHLIGIVIALAIFIFFLILRKLFVKYILKLVLGLTSKTGTAVDTLIVRSLEKPLRAFLILLGLYLALSFLPLPEVFNEKMVGVWRIAIIILCTWGLYNFIGNYSTLFYEVGNRLDINIDSILASFLAKVMRGILLLLAFVIIVSELGYDINGFIAGLGLGGLTIALAAQNTASNIFGGIVIIVDKPFSIGDWILTPSVEGTVEDITFRSTKIRTFADALVTVPNATLANEAVTNWTRMGRRRVSFKLGLTYSTPKMKIQSCVDKIKDMLDNHDDIHKKTIFVRFDSFNESSLDIFIYFFTKTTVWGDYLKVKEDINFKIMDIIENEGVSVAFPSRSIYMEKPLDRA